MIVEFPDADTCSGAVGSAHAQEMRSARAALIAAEGQPSSSHFINLSGTATITGVGFFDFIHGQTGVAPNGIELHPVVSFSSDGGPQPYACTNGYSTARNQLPVRIDGLQLLGLPVACRGPAHLPEARRQPDQQLVRPRRGPRRDRLRVVAVRTSTRLPVSLVHAACRGCGFAATIGIGRDERASVPVHWAPARCPACGLVSVNIYSYGFDTEPACRECGAKRVELYVDWGKIPQPPDQQPCPECQALKFSFTVAQH